MSRKMNEIVNNTNMEIYKAKAKTIFDEARKALVNDEITMQELLKLDLEFDKAVMGVIECKNEQARLNNEEVQHERLLNLAREIVYGGSEDENDETDESSMSNPQMNDVFGMIFRRMFGM